MPNKSASGPPASKIFHWALITLMPAMGLSYTAYQLGFPWHFSLLALLFWALGIYFLKRGSDKAKQEHR